MFCGPSSLQQRKPLSSKQALELADICLNHARQAKDSDSSSIWCDEAEAALSQIKKTAKGNTSAQKEGRTLSDGIGAAYACLSELQHTLGKSTKADINGRKAGQWGTQTPPKPKSVQPSHGQSSLAGEDAVPFPQNIFPHNISPPNILRHLPEADERLDSTAQLAYCLGLLQVVQAQDDETSIRQWVRDVVNDVDEHDRLRMLATDVIRAFKRDELKGTEAITEVVLLAPVLQRDDFRSLLKEFFSGIEHADLLNIHQLDGLSRLIQGARPVDLDSDDLVKILSLLSSRLRHVHRQSQHHIYQLTLAVSNVLDAMADTKVRGLDRETLHEPLAAYLEGLKGSSDPYLVYQAAYAFQALQCVPDNETLWQATLRRTGKVIQGVSGLASAVKGFDLNKFMEGLGDIQQGLGGVSRAVQVAQAAYKDVASLAQGGMNFLDSLKEGLSFERKRAWYPALRGASVLIQEGQLANFRILVCEGPCRRDPAFQWGVCQRLGEIALDQAWDADVRKRAVDFLGDIYRNDLVWGQNANVKQWILDILIQIAASSTLSGSTAEYAKTVLEDLKTDGDLNKQTLYQTCRKDGPSQRSLKIDVPCTDSSALLNLVQNKPDVEAGLRQLKKRRLDERSTAVYIPPQAKASLQAPDDARFPLMDKVQEFLGSEQKVFLLLGDSGAGKSTFNKALEWRLWDAYKKKDGRIPLYINLPAIDKPDQDMIAKQLRKAEFSENQIRELKIHRKFILICDGYDESQQTQNLYMSNRLNQPEEWQAKMIISCRSEYTGADYRDRFQPIDRNRRSDPTQFQEAVMTPFTTDQVQDYIRQYVSIHRPLWRVEDYLQVLDLIPSLKELVKNPFLMTLSLEVLPRMVDPGKHLSVTHVTRVALYDQFIEQWLERGKRRLGEKELSSSAKSAFDSLSDQGFTLNGIDYLKKLSAAIYREQGGQPVVEYSHIRDEGSWKAEFFSREDETFLLRESCPLTRNGNQYRFIHRSLLEYGLSLAAFDPQSQKKQGPETVAMGRRGSFSSTWSFDMENSLEQAAALPAGATEIDITSPLVWRILVNETSLLQFMEERVQQEPMFKKQLLNYVELSKTDKQWRTAAANAMTILVRAGVQFNNADLQGIQIPGADLAYGVFDSANLQGADLRKASLHGTWLNKANMTGTRLAKVRFGELPYLEQEDEIHSFAYSPDVTSFAVGIKGGDINVYTIPTWERMPTLRGHSDSVTCIVYSPRGSQMASSSLDTTIRLWNVQTGKLTGRLTGHTDCVCTIAYSPQGDMLASGSNDNSIRLWDTKTNECHGAITGHSKRVVHVVFSPLGNQIASGSWDSTARVWDIKSGTVISLDGGDGYVRNLAYSPRGDLIATPGDDHIVRLWDVESGVCLHAWTGHRYRVSMVVFSPKGGLVASASVDKTVRLWDVESGTCRHTLTGHRNEVMSIAYSPNGDYVASASFDKTLRLWDVESGACREIFSGHLHRVTEVLYSPDGNQLASCSEDNTVRLWDIGSGTSRNASSSHGDAVTAVKFTPTGDQVASCSQDASVRIWNVETGSWRLTLNGAKLAMNCVDFSPQGQQAATGSWDNRVRLFDMNTGACLFVLEGHQGEITSLAYSPDGNTVASASRDQTVRLWNVETGESHTLSEHEDAVSCIAYSPDGKVIATGSGDCTIRLWDVESRECIQTLSEHEDWVVAVIYLQDDQLVSASDDDTIRLWDLKTGECLHVFEGHEKSMDMVLYSPIWNQIASASQDSTVRLWDVASRTCLHVLTGHSKDVKAIAYSCQGDLLASGSDDKTVRIWDVASGQCLKVIQDFRKSVVSVAWSPRSDDRVYCLAIGSGDNSVRVWEGRNENSGEHDNNHSPSRTWNLRWRTTSGALTLTDASIQDVQELSQLNRLLMEQRGAGVGLASG